jgi:protein ImuB
MKRVLCVWFPRWSVQRLVESNPELRDQAVVVYSRGGRAGAQVVACSRQAVKLGVAVGMSLAEAGMLGKGESGTKPATKRRQRSSNRSSLGGLHGPFHVVAFDPLEDRKALERLAHWCERFGPTVGLEESEPPENLLLDVTGCEQLFGGEHALARKVADALAQRGYEVRVALADTIGAAWATAHYGGEGWNSSRQVFVIPRGLAAEALGPLPVAALRLSSRTVELLHELGIRHIGQLLQMDRSGWPARFGPELLSRLDQATGAAEELIAPCRSLPLPQAGWTFEPPTERHETLRAAIERLLERVLEQLPARMGVTRLVCRLDSSAGRPPAWFWVDLFRPSASVRHLSELLRLQLERRGAPGPVAELRLSVTATSLLESRQAVFGEAGGVEADDPAEQLARLMDRLTSRLGRESVLRIIPIPDAQPEFGCRFEPWLDNPRLRLSRPGSSHVSASPSFPAPWAGVRPLRLLATPLLVETVSVVPDGPPIRFRLAGAEHVVAHAQGPERIETGWWRSHDAQRDYYRVETVSGQRCWLFRRLCDGRWFLHGWFA